MTQALAMAVSVRARRRQAQQPWHAQPWLHPAISGLHVVSMTRSFDGSEVLSVATCRCSWSCRFAIADFAEQDAAVDGHWREIIAATGAAK
jgi:hypothetical protein